MSPLADSAFAFLVTYAVHGTVALLVAWAACAVVALPLRWQEAAWRFALAGSVLSALLQVAFFSGVRPDLLAAWPRPSVAGGAATSATAASPAEPKLAAPGTARPEAREARRFATPIAFSAAALAAGGALLLLRARVRLARALRGRVPLADAFVLSSAAEVARRLGLRHTPALSTCGELAAPVAFGWLRPEVCLPERARALSAPELRAVLTHELAHLRRRDPAWLWLGAGLHALFPWQPLLLLARRRLSRIAELRCDAEAVGSDGGVAVARALVEVAAWLGAGRARAGDTAAVALGMAGSGSLLRERVERALRETGPERGVPLLPAGLVACAALALLTAVLPGTGLAARDEDEPSPEASEDGGSAEHPAGTLAASLARLDAECELLAAEARALRDELGAKARDPEIAARLARLSVQLAAMERVRQRLQALPARTFDADDTRTPEGARR